MIKIECPQCGRSLTVPESEAGLAAVCNACGHRLIVPGRVTPLSSVESLPALWEALGTPTELGGGSADASASAIEHMLAPPSVPGVPSEAPAVRTPNDGGGGGGDMTIQQFVGVPGTTPGVGTPASPVTIPQPALTQQPVDRPAGRRPIDKVQLTLTATSLACTFLVTIVVAIAAKRGRVMTLDDGAEARGPSGWDVDHRGELRRLIGDADERIIAGDLPGAVRAYDRIDRYVAGHRIEDAAIRAELDRVASNRRQVERAMARRATERAAAMAAAAPDAPAKADAATPVTPSVNVPSPAITTTRPAGSPMHAAGATVLHVQRQPDPPEEVVSEKRINASIQRGVNWMLRRFNPQTGVMADPGESSRHGAETALCTYALLQAGLAVPDERLDVHGSFAPKMLANLASLRMEPDVETYGRGLRASALALHHRPSDMAALQADLVWLLRAHKGGAYSYDEPKAKEGQWDNSNSQYGLLGTWAAAEAGLEVPGPYWKMVQDHWTANQTTDGSWGYSGGGSGDSIPMTCAGLASLFVTHDYLEPVRTGTTQDVGRAPMPPGLAKGLAWLEKDNRVVDGASSGYGLYAVERVGLASGFKFLGKRDWFRELSKATLERQGEDGSWGGGDIVETSFALLFLSRGSHPILMNKLRFDGAWANRPRDLASLTRYASRAMEQPLNWQVVDADRDWTDWADAPILYLASHERPKLDDGQVEQIRRYVESGGMLYTQADGGRPEFDAYARELAKRLFPDYPMAALPQDHDLYTVVFPIEATARPPLWAVSNGARLLMVHSPTDLSAGWQMRAEKQRAGAFQFGVNLFVYATGKAPPRRRLATNVLPEPAPPQGGQVKVIRVRHDGNWDPEPGAYDRFRRWFTHETDCGINGVVVDLARLRPEIARVAHLTSTSAFTASEAEVEALRQYVDGGGVLLVDTCGGSERVAASLAAMIGRAFPDAALKKLPASHPVFNASAPGMEALAAEPEVRAYALRKYGKGAGVPEGFAHGSGQVIFCSLDLMSGLLGTSTWGIAGYEPGYAEGLLRNVLLWGSGETRNQNSESRSKSE